MKQLNLESGTDSQSNLKVNLQSNLQRNQQNIFESSTEQNSKLRNSAAEFFPSNDLTYIESNILHEKLLDLAATERKLTAEIVEYLAEVDRRRYFINLGYASLFEYCAKGLKYSEGSAARRINSARLISQVPEIKEKIEHGSLSITQISQIVTSIKKSEQGTRQKISLDQKKELLKKIEHKTFRETEKELAQSLNLKAIEHTQIKIKKDEVFEIKLSLTKEEYELVDMVKKDLSHSVPTQDIKDLLFFLCKKHQALLCKKSKKIKDNFAENKHAENKSMTESKTPFRSNVEKQCANGNIRKPISEKIKFQLKEKANHQCEWRHPITNHRCECKVFLEIDHVQEVFFGGGNQLENFRVLCRIHNQFEASQKNLC